MPRPLPRRRYPGLDLLVEAVETGGPLLSIEERAAVLADVRSFVEAELERMAPHLRLAFGLAWRAFRLTAWRSGRPLERLDGASRARLLEAWAHSPLAWMRSLPRLIRGLALFAYFEHPAVRARLESASSDS